jgi:hypothetical protein
MLYFVIFLFVIILVLMFNRGAHMNDCDDDDGCN